MKRIAVLVVLVAAAALSGGENSHAAMTAVNGFCFQSPYNTVVPCTTSPTPTRALILPNKTLSVSGPVAAPLDTMTYLVTITSEHCLFRVGRASSGLSDGWWKRRCCSQPPAAGWYGRSESAVRGDPC